MYHLRMVWIQQFKVGGTRWAQPEILDLEFVLSAQSITKESPFSKNTTFW